MKKNELINWIVLENDGNPLVRDILLNMREDEFLRTFKSMGISLEILRKNLYYIVP